MNPTEVIDTEVVLLTSEQGGRSNPLLPLAYGGSYRPHIVIQSRNIREASLSGNTILDDYLGVAFMSGPDPLPIGEPVQIQMSLMYAPHKAYDEAIPGADFTLREGPKIIGHGTIKKRYKSNQTVEPTSLRSAAHG